MKIAIDLRPLQVGHQNRGIGNYLLNILKYFPVEGVKYIFIRYDESNPIVDFGIKIGEQGYEEVVVKHYRFSRNPRNLIFFVIGLLDPVYLKVSHHKPDVYFQSDYLFGIPRRWRTKKVVVAYDLIPFLFRNMYMPRWTKYVGMRHLRIRSRLLQSVRAYFYERKYKTGLKTLRRANLVLSISETTTKDLVTVARISPKKIRTIRLAPSFVTAEKVDSKKQLLSEIKKISGKYLLFIGGTDARRQVHELIFAFNQLNARGYDFSLVLAGSEFVEKSKELNPKTRKAIEASSYRDKIHMLGKISEQEKRYILENAFAFVYPTLYEGFGLPVLEAMAQSCPVISYDNPAIQEVAKDAAHYIDPGQGGFGIYKGVITLTDQQKRRALIERGVAVSETFDWEETGKKTIKAILG